MVFLTESGIGLMYFQIKNFQHNVWMGDAIINCFASMLNYEEASRTKGTSLRLF
ncbi:hypothetical protein HanIR_Chr17g0864251 [Helianthus annuus]|nr:hypothetical protein HanIR_Chr17g0864251 [Helianthus annuus]